MPLEIELRDQFSTATNRMSGHKCPFTNQVLSLSLSKFAFVLSAKGGVIGFISFAVNTNAYS
jgi:hypothetical protein